MLGLPLSVLVGLAVAMSALEVEEEWSTGPDAWLATLALPLSVLVGLAIAVLAPAVGEEWPKNPNIRLTMLLLPLSALVGLEVAVSALVGLAPAVPAVAVLVLMGVPLAVLASAVEKGWPNSPNAWPAAPALPLSVLPMPALAGLALAEERSNSATPWLSRPIGKQPASASSANGPTSLTQHSNERRISAALPKVRQRSSGGSIKKA
jgi:hypothetical protein